MLDGYRCPFRVARELRGWSLAEIANQLGVDRATVSRWERGVTMPHRVHRARLETLFGKTAEELGLLLENEEDNMAVEEATPPVAQLKEDIVVCLNGEALAVIDMFIKVGICTSRSHAVAWLALTGIQVHQPFLQKIPSEMAAEIQHLREQAQLLAES